MRIANRPVLSRTAHALVLSAAASLALLLMLVTGSDTIVQAQTPDTPTPETPQGPGDWDGVENLTPIEGERNPPMYPNMDSNLNRIVEQVQTGQFSAQAAAANAPIHREESVAVTLYITEGYAQDVWDYLEQSGASPRNIGADYIEAYIPVSLLPEASTQEGVISIRTIIPPEPAQGTVVSEGAAAHGAPAWHAAGLKGQSVKIGIIDTGFEGFQSLMGTELPSSVEARCYTDVGVFTFNLADCDTSDGGKHGTAVTEALFDIAPGAAYYISNPPTQGDLQATVAWMIDHDVDVINMSETWTWDGPGDGTSPYSSSPLRSVDTAVAGGITWINNAGNNAEHTWFGSFSDKNDSDYWHNFEGDDECNNVELEAGERISVQLRWDSRWGGATRDLDIYLLPRGGGADDALALSENEQSGGIDHAPYESFSFTPDTDGNYCLAIWHYSGSQPSWIQLLTWGGDTLEYHTSNGSIGNPSESANSGLLAVGAANWRDTSEIDYYSSRGPTPDDRIKPDIVGASGGRTVTWRSEDNPEGYFGGTSSSAPHIAGLSALVTQRFPDYTPQQVTNYIKTHADARGLVPNNTWGYGFAKLAASDAATPTPEPTVTPEPTPEPTATPEPTPPADPCVENLDADSTIQGSWSDGCPSESRSGSYASYYTFSLAESSDVTIGIESAVDTYLFVLEGPGRTGTVLHENDDIVSGNTNSQISESLAAGIYTIEATTYDSGATGEFTLTVSGLPATATSDPTPEPPRTPHLILRVVRVTEDWMPYASTDGWTAAVPLKESDTLKYYEVAIWEETDSVHLYEFPNTYDPLWGQRNNLTDEEMIAYREQFLVRKYANMPQPWTDERSSFLESAFSDIASILVNRHPTSEHHLIYSGHGGPGGRLFAGHLNHEDAHDFLEIWSSKLGRSLGVLDMGGPCNKGSFADLDNFCEFSRYYIASDLPNGGYTMDEWTIEKHLETYPEAQYHNLLASSATLEEALKGRIDLVRKRYEYSRNNMVTNRVSQANYLYSCSTFLEFSTDFKLFLEELDIDFDISDDLLQFMEENGADSALLDGFDNVFIHSADNRDFFEWSVIANGMLMPLPPTAMPTPPADSCVEPVDADGTVSGSGTTTGNWSSDCASEGRSGSYASYYTFTLAESADLTITAESTVDTYLNLRDGAGRDGTILHFNDDHDSSEFSLPSSTDSGISESLGAGSYMIEVTTYTAGETGDFTLTISGLPAAVTPTPEPTPTITIAFGDLNWPSVRLQTRIAQYIAEMGYGYSTSVESGTAGPLFQALRAGNIDVLMEVWLPNQEEDWEAALAEGSVSSPGRSLGTDWQSAFVIPKYLQEQYPDLDSVEDLKEEQYRSLFATNETDGKARLVSCVIGWYCEGVNAKQVEGYGLSDHVHIVNPENFGALNADLTEAYENEEPWLGYQWGTNEAAFLFDLVRLEEPAYSDECWATTMACAYEDSTILVAVNAELPDSAPDFVDALTEWDFNVDGVYKPVVRWQADNPEANTEDAALWWLRGNGDVWSDWVTADAGAAMQSALDSGETPDGWPEEPNITPEPTPEPPADSCVSAVSGNGAISGSWDSDCASEGRSGSYASYHTFTLTETADVTITAESGVDTYLFLREGAGRDGSVVDENDDHDNSEFSLGSTTDSGLSESLDAGTYTIEVTTYNEGKTGEFTLTISGLPATVTPQPSIDRAALVALYNATNGANWTDKDNWLSDRPLGEWQGVDTDDEGRVTQIRLGENNLVGSIPSDLGDLSNLEILSLEVNQLSGVIPTELGNLSNLTELYLWENQLSGEIPSELGNLSNLTVLYMPGNELTGEIPSELGSLSNLEVLGLWGNELSGEIPVELGNLSNLERLSLPSNQLSGEIPTELASLSNLTDLLLGGNQLTGTIPAQLGSLSNLKVLWLTSNNLTGTIPSELGNLSNLTELYIGLNQLTGTIPAELGSLSNLKYLFLGGNDLTGTIPSELGNLSNLRQIDLGGNALTGTIPVQLVNLPNLISLWLGGNNLTGNIPPELGNRSNLRHLELRGNGLTGTIPPALGNLHNLQSLRLAANQLTGTIPAELGNLSNLKVLKLNSNQLTGTIPPGLGGLSNLEDLWLNHNELTGVIPIGLGNLSDLEELYLQYNQLTDPLPHSLTNLTTLSQFAFGHNAGLCAPTDDVFQTWLQGIPNQDYGITPLGPNCEEQSATTPITTEDRAALVALYNATGGDNWTDNTNWLSDEPLGEWHGVTTDDEGRVTQLDLWENNLTGTIPSELASLSSLTLLDLGTNRLSGEIPSELGSLSNLEVLSLSYNRLSGEIPSTLGSLSSLIELYLNDNLLSGEIPSELGNLTNLTELQLWDNELSGEIPAALGSLDSLVVVGLDGNQLSGEIPSELGSLSNLEVLSLSYNRLSGEIPAELGGLSNLEELYLNENELSGEVPLELGNLSNLTVLDMPGNELSGQIPSELGNLSNLEILSLWGNQLSSEIPSELGSLSNLTELQLCCNELSGEIPAELGNLASLVVIGLDENQLNGEIPEELGNLSNLTELALWENQLSGEIPSELGGLANLQRLYLGENDLSGEIPAALGSLASLEELDLRDNELSGEVPEELGNLSSLTELHLCCNELSGEIPAELGNLASLVVIGLDENQLNGEIPEELGNLSNLTELALWENQLSGEIPSELGGLANLQRLYLGENDLSGEIPSELGGLANLTVLYAWNNQLSGEIPEELGNLSNLTELGLWGNELSGEIPSELGSLSNLTELYLNANQLSGEIPAELGNMSSLERLYLNENQLSGEIPSELGNLSSLERMSLGDNQLSGGIPAELGSLSNLERMFLHGNQLSGEIPSELGRLSNLISLHLEENQLSGEIPSELLALLDLEIMTLWGNQFHGDVLTHASDRNALSSLYNATSGTGWTDNEHWLTNEPVFAWYGVGIDTNGHVTALLLEDNQLTGEMPSELGSLSSLIWLNLSENQLSGEIPPELGNLSNLEWLSLVENELSGCVPSGLINVEFNDLDDLGLPLCSDGN